MELDEVTEQIIGAAIEVHREKGPGLLESAYRRCMCRELELRDLRYKTEMVLPIHYKGVEIDSGYRLDLLVENLVVVEIKAVQELASIFEAQLLTYLRQGGWKVGLLINFNVRLLKNGLKRKVNNY